MTQVSENFKRSEFECPCGCGFAAVDVVLLKTLENFRAFLNEEQCKVRIIILSGCRCFTHNAKVGGAPKSYHLRGLGVDFIVLYSSKNRRMCPDLVTFYFNCMYHDRFGFITYDTFNHLDVRDDSFFRLDKPMQRITHEQGQTKILE